MKKIKIFLALVTTSLLGVVACQKENAVNVNGVKGELSEFSGITEEAQVKADVEKVSDKYVVNWASGDVVYIAESATKAAKYDVASTGQTSTEFAFKELAAGATAEPSAAPYYACCPAGICSGLNDGAVVLSLPAVQSYKADGIAGFPIVAKGSSKTLQFESLLSVVRVNLKTLTDQTIKSISIESAGEKLWGTATVAFGELSGTKYPVSTVSIANDDSKANVVTLDCGEGVSVSAGNQSQFLIAIPAGAYSAGIKFIVTNSEGVSETRTFGAPFTFVRSTIHGTALLTYDFVFDYCFGEANTVNVYNQASCEIALTPYGVDKTSYKRIAGVVGAPALSSAELVWRESSLTIGSIVLSDDKSKLTLSSISGTGNAVVAVKSGDDIVWSFQIWKPDMDVDANLITYNTSHQVMPIALGAVKVVASGATASEKAESCGQFYQFGRKDPLGRASSTATGTTALTETVDKDGEAVVLNTKVNGTVMNWNIKDAVVWARKNPDTFKYGVTGAYSNGIATWLPQDGSAALWGDPSNTNPANRKTVYDPCPAGYKVPNCSKVFAGFSTSTVTYTEGDGFRHNTTNDYFPACGGRGPSRAGALGDVGTSGNCRSSAPTTSASSWWDCCVLRLSSTAVNPAYNDRWRGIGYAVRCVKE